MRSLRLVGFHVRMRRWTVVLLAAVGIAYVVLSATTVPSFIGDPYIPRARTTLVVGCAAATLLCLFVRPLMRERERLAARRMQPARWGLIVIVVIGWLVATWVAITLAHDAAFATQRLSVTAALMGIALGCSVLGEFWALLVPWGYVLCGLSFGYEADVEQGGVTLRPWAWLVRSDDGRHLWLELSVLATGIAIASLRRARGSVDE